jgi:hypothetical protein
MEANMNLDDAKFYVGAQVVKAKRHLMEDKEQRDLYLEEERLRSDEIYNSKNGLWKLFHKRLGILEIDDLPPSWSYPTWFNPIQELYDIKKRIRWMKDSLKVSENLELILNRLPPLNEIIFTDKEVRDLTYID